MLAVLASLTFRGLASVLDAEAHLREEARRWSDVSLVFGQMREDVSSAIAARGVALGDGGTALVLTRFSELPGMPPRRVGYRLREGVLEYLLWPSEDASEAAAHPVLPGVAQLRISALGENGAWTATWPAATSALPRALAVELVLARGERVTRLYPL